MGQPLKFVDYFRHTIAPSAIEMGTSSVPLKSATNEQEWLGCYFESSGQTSYGMRIQIEKTSATAGAPRALTLRTILGHSSGLAPQGANSVDARVTLETGNTGISGEMHAMESQCRVDGESRGVNGTYAAHKFTNNFGALNTMPVDTFFLRFYDAGTVKTPRLFGFTGLTAGTGNLYYNETLKIKVNTNDRWIPLSTIQGTYTTAYPIVSSLASGACIDLTAPATGIDIGDCSIGLAMTGATRWGIKQTGNTFLGMLQQWTFNAAVSGESDKHTKGIYQIITHALDEDLSGNTGADLIGIQTFLNKTTNKGRDIIGFKNDIVFSKQMRRATGIDIECHAQSGASLSGGTANTNGLRYQGLYVHQGSSNAVEGEAAIAIDDDWDAGIYVEPTEVSNFVKFYSAAGCVAANTHAIDQHSLQHVITVKIGTDVGYIPVFADVPS